MLDALRQRRADSVVTATDAHWDEARQAFNLAIDQRPEAVVFPQDADDVVATIEQARREGLRIAPQRTGHAAGALDALAGAVLLRTDAMKGVEVDRDARRVRVNAGAQWGDVTAVTSPAGLTPLLGSSPNVGVVGYSLGGGASFIGRKHGLAANSVKAIELVTADGRQLRVDAENEPDLFWALRGGGGGLGVVTALEFEAFDEPKIYAGAALFPIERAGEVLHAWRGITETAPDELTTLGRLLRVPDVEGPPPLRGRAFALVEVIYLGDEADGAELIAPLLDLGPELQTLAMVEPAALQALHMDPPEPVPARTHHVLASELPASAIDDVLEVAGPGTDCMLVSVELRQTGGALGRPAPDGGALASLPGSFYLFAVGALMDPSLAPTIGEQLEQVGGCLKPYEAGRYFNFSERLEPGSAFFDGDTLGRLQAIKAEWDPDGLFQCPHPVGAG